MRNSTFGRAIEVAHRNAKLDAGRFKILDANATAFA